MALTERARRLLPGLWAGFLICVAAVAAPAAFATLVTADAGRVVSRIFVQEAYGSLLLGAAMLVLERIAARRRSATVQGPQFSVGMVLAASAMFCTIAGYFAVQTMLPAARAGQAPLSFGQLHAVSASFFAIKTVAVAALAWRAAGTKT
jgi:hypothetical protein